MSDRILVFSDSETEQRCVDCGKKATFRIAYAKYGIGDLVCSDDADWRRSLIPRSVRTPIPPRVSIVQFDKGQAA